MNLNQSKILFKFLVSSMAALCITLWNSHYPQANKTVVTNKTLNHNLERTPSSSRPECVADIIALSRNYGAFAELKARYRDLVDRVLPASDIEDNASVIRLAQTVFPDLAWQIDQSTPGLRRLMQRKLRRYKGEIVQQFEALDLNSSQANFVREMLDTIENPTLNQLSDALSGIQLMKSMRPREFNDGLRQIFTGMRTGKTNMFKTIGIPFVRQDKRFLRKFVRFKKRMDRSEKSWVNKHPKEQRDIIKKISAREWRLNHSQKVLACRSSGSNLIQKEAFDTFSRYQRRMALTLYPIVYYGKEYSRINAMVAANHPDWVAWEFTREIGMNFIYTLAVIAVFRGNTSGKFGPVLKWMKNNQYWSLLGLYSLVGLGDPLGFNNVSDTYNQRAQLFMEQAAAHPDFKQKILDFKTNIETDFDLVNFEDDLENIVNGRTGREALLTRVDEFIETSGLFPDTESQQSARAVVREGVNQNIEDPMMQINNLPSDERSQLRQWLDGERLENEEEFREFEFLMSLYFYEQVEGLIHTGDVGWDRYWHSRVYTVGSVVKDLVIGSAIFQMFCVHGFGKMTFLKAIGLSLINTVGFSYLFVDTRGRMINTPVEVYGMNKSINDMIMHTVFGESETWFDREQDLLEQEINQEYGVEETP